MLRELVIWWVRQMTDLLGDGFAGRAAPWRNALVIEARDSAAGSISMTCRRRNREITLGQHNLDEAGLAAMCRALSGMRLPRDVVLRVPAEMFLERQVILPLVVEPESERVLGYEMDRLTPFTAAEVFWAWSIERRNLTARRLHLRLIFVPRQRIQPLLAMLRRSNIEPTILEALSAAGTSRTITLQHKPANRRFVLTAAAAICAVLAMVAVTQPFVMQSIALSRAARQLAELQPKVTQVEALRRDIAGQTVGTAFIAAERSRIGDILAALAKVTKILPDDAVLTAFTMSERKLSLDGQAAEAARLITALAADPALRDPTFAGPVTRVPHGHADLFSIRAGLGP